MKRNLMKVTPLANGSVWEICGSDSIRRLLRFCSANEQKLPIVDRSDDRSHDLDQTTLWILNRPEALSALSFPMALAMRERYLQRWGKLWSKSPSLRHHVLIMASIGSSSLFSKDVVIEKTRDSSPDAVVTMTMSTKSRERQRPPFFCAGGDVRAMYVHGLEGGCRGKQREFFEQEYLLNSLLGGGLGVYVERGFARLDNRDTLAAVQPGRQPPVVQVSLLDGIVMGGGAGLSLHGAFRVATENTVFAMPECAIGFHPDIGSTWFLPRLVDWMRARQRCSVRKTPNAISVGLWLALTGARVRGRDCVQLGIATHFCESSRLADVVASICDVAEQTTRSVGSGPDDKDSYLEENLNVALAAFHDAPTSRDSLLDLYGEAIEHHFSPDRHDTLESMLRSLKDTVSGKATTATTVTDSQWTESRDQRFAKECLQSMQRASPLSLLVAFEAIGRHGPRSSSLQECLRREFRTTLQMLKYPDFMEGVRAQLVDKDYTPRWASASSIDAWLQHHDHKQTMQMIDAFFTLPEGENDLALDMPSNSHDACL